MPSTWCVTIPHSRDRVERRQQRHEDRPTTFQAEVERSSRPRRRDGGRDRGSGLGNLDAPGCGVDRQRHVPALGIVQHPEVPGVAAEVVHGVTKRVPSGRHLVDRRLVVSLAVPREVHEGGRQCETARNHGCRRRRRRGADSVPGREAASPGEPPRGDERHARDRRREGRRGTEPEREARPDADVEQAQPAEQRRAGAPGHSLQDVRPTSEASRGCCVVSVTAA